MTFNIGESPILIAPRPVRLGSATSFLARSHPARIVSASETLDRVTPLEDFRVGISETSPILERDSVSPRAASRSGLPTEALEEFLSILRPSFFPSRSPVLRSRRQASMPSFGRISRLDLRGDVAEDTVADLARSTSPRFDFEDFVDRSELDEFSPFRWFKSTVLSSPVSRMHTRNPFQRQITNQSPSPIGSSHPLSPAAIPLPLPTPDEVLDMN